MLPIRNLLSGVAIILCAIISPLSNSAFAQIQLKSRKIQTAISEPQGRHRSVWTIAIMFVFVLMSMIPSKALAQGICNRTVNYTGTYQEFFIPDNITEITFEAKGGNGGSARIRSQLCFLFYDVDVTQCYNPGGKGMVARATFSVGYDDEAVQLTPLSTIRIVVGGQGQSDNSDVCFVGTGNAVGGGGGGTGVYYQAPGSSEWQILLAVGGGGGSYALMLSNYCFVDQATAGRNGAYGQAGHDGNSGILGGGTGGSDGSGGTGGGIQTPGLGGPIPYGVAYSAGGGGAYENGSGILVPNICSQGIEMGHGGMGIPTGGFGGEDFDCISNQLYGSVSPGGFGFGGGGAGFFNDTFGASIGPLTIFSIAGAGGGGGYSGGGGGGDSSGGGGGGRYTSPKATSQAEGYSFPAIPADGYVTVTCGGNQYSECSPAVTLTTEPGEAFATANLAAPTVDDCNVPGNALHFDGVDDFVSTNSSMDLLNGWTLETWVKRDVTGSQHSLIEKYDCLEGSGGYVLRILPDGRAMAVIIDNCGGQSVAGTTVLNSGIWYHLAATFDPLNDRLKIYVNGVLEGTNNSATLEPMASTLPMKLGSRGNDNLTPLHGAMDEVRIWNVVQSQAQIQANMNCEFTSKASGLEAVYNFNSGTASGDNDGNTYAFDYASGNDGELFNFALTGSTSNWVMGNAWSTLVADVPETYPIGNTIVVWSVTDENGITSTCGQSVTVYDNEDPVISCAPEQVVSTDSDQCELQVILSEPTVSDNGHPSSNALDFDGLDDFVDLGNVPEANFGTGDFTIEFWMNTTNIPEAPMEIITKRAICECANLWNVDLLSSGKLRFEALEAGCGNFSTLETNQTVNDGNWHHIAIRRSGAELSIYKDGTLSGLSVPGFITNLNNTGPVRIGKSACSDLAFSGYYEGQLDEVRIWDEARSDTEINSNMHTALSPQPGLKILLDLNEGLADGDNTGIPPTALDGSGNNNNGTLNNFGLIGDNSNWVSRFRAGLSITNDSPGLFPIGETTVTWTATDAGGNIATCTQNVVVIDNVSPVIACPSDTTLNTDPGEDFATITILPPAATDNCSELGNALSFDGIDDQVTISNPVDSVFTLEAWIKTSATSLTGVDAYQGNGILWSDVAFNANDFTLAILNDHLSFYDGSGNISTEGTTILNDDLWHHIAVVRNGVLGTTSLYVDGMLDASNTCNNVELNENPEIVIGGNPFGGYFNGSIDEVRIWSGALSEAAIQTYMDRSISSQLGLSASYHFNEGVAGGDNSGIMTAIDASGNANDGMLDNFDLSGTLSNWVDNSEMTFTNDAPATFSIGSTTVTWTATDPSGNEASCEFTVTVIPEYATLNGNVSDLLGCGEREITLAIYDSESSEMGELVVTTIDSNGDYDTPDFPIGTYDIYVTVQGYLTKLYSEVLIENGSNELDISGIIPGDLNSSNGVNIVDVSIMSAAFGSSTGDGNYNFLADFNCDGGINIIDVSILNVSFGLVGDSPPIE